MDRKVSHRKKAKDAIALNMMSNEEAVVTVQKGDVVVTRHSCDMGICSKANMGKAS